MPFSISTPLKPPRATSPEGRILVEVWKMLEYAFTVEHEGIVLVAVTDDIAAMGIHFTRIRTALEVIDKMRDQVETLIKRYEGVTHEQTEDKADPARRR